MCWDDRFQLPELWGATYPLLRGRADLTRDNSKTAVPCSDGSRPARLLALPRTFVVGSSAALVRHSPQTLGVGPRGACRPRPLPRPFRAADQQRRASRGGLRPPSHRRDGAAAGHSFLAARPLRRRGRRVGHPPHGQPFFRHAPLPAPVPARSARRLPLATDGRAAGGGQRLAAAARWARRLPAAAGRAPLGTPAPPRTTTPPRPSIATPPPPRPTVGDTAARRPSGQWRRRVRSVARGLADGGGAREVRDRRVGDGVVVVGDQTVVGGVGGTPSVCVAGGRFVPPAAPRVGGRARGEARAGGNRGRVAWKEGRRRANRSALPAGRHPIRWACVCSGDGRGSGGGGGRNPRRARRRGCQRVHGRRRAATTGGRGGHAATLHRPRLSPSPSSSSSSQVGRRPRRRDRPSRCRPPDPHPFPPPPKQPPRSPL